MQSFNRPTQLLRQYLDRRNQLLYGYPSTPRESELNPRERKTLSDFRVKKSRKTAQNWFSQHGEAAISGEAPELMVDIGAGKNLYNMSKEEL